MEMNLQQLKDFIIRSIGQDHRKRVQKVYYRYPHEVDRTFYFKSIRRAVEYKILESDRLKYAVQCAQFGSVCWWSICISYRRKQKKWEVRRYNGPHSYMETSVRLDHRRLDSKVIADVIFSMVQADLSISIRVLEGSVETHFEYQA
ncbi:hypothetical protein PIB30_055833 [Stylosanthes scabra]|uniref:Transposase MuDR plant domain-containing protein n=1 Tax=Stylosanthes scabra TaxID=79078 RepID=A0ABU6XI85_9FABA|nr:hypothetical protein [Stylosanthes scabra]